MSVDLTGPGPDFTSPDPALPRSATGIRPLVLGACILLVASAVLDRALPAEDPARLALDTLIWVTVPALAIAATGRAALAATGYLRATWFAYSAAALLALVARTPWVAQQPMLLGATGRQIALAAQLMLCLVLGCAAVLAVRRAATRRHELDTSLDASVVMVSGLILLERFFFPRLQSETVMPGDFLVGLLSGLFSLGTLFCTIFMVLRPTYRLPGHAPFLLLAATCFLLLGGLLGIVQGAGERAVDTVARLTPDRIATLAGWLILSLTAVAATRAPPAEAEGRAPPRALFRFQQALIPGAALILGALIVDGALRARPSLETALAGALLAALLALRLGRTIRADHQHAEAQRLLAQNNALMEVSRALADATDLNRILDLVVRWASKLLEAPSAGLELLDTEQDELELRAVCGLPNHLLGLRTPVDGSLTGSVVRSARATAISAPGYGAFYLPNSETGIGAFPTAVAPLHYRDQRLGTIFALRFDRDFDDADLELLSALADQASLAIRNAQLFEEVRALSLTDPLTGLANRRQLTRDLNREFAATRRGRRLIAVLFDMDNFKEYNDQYGHPAGDEVLRLFGEALARETRSMNLAARYGGDEFISLLADTSLDGARIFIERVVAHFQKAMDELGRGTITVSAGLAECDQNMQSPDELVAAADKAMYRVKPTRSARGAQKEPTQS